MTEYIARKIKFVNNDKVDIPVGSIQTQVVRDPLLDEWVIMFLEPVCQPQ